MEVFLLLALIFVPFVWFIVRALRYTDETIGEGSPLKTVVTYSVSAWQHFTHFNLVSALVAGVILLPLPIIILANLDTASEFWHYGIALFVLLSTGWFYYSLFTLIQLHIRFWLITNGVTLTLDPSTKSIFIEHYGSSVCLQASTVKRIDYHATELGGSKLFQGYGYYEFIGFDNQVTVLNASPSFLYFAVDEYFRNIPQISHSHKIPWPPVAVTHAATELC